MFVFPDSIVFLPWTSLSTHVDGGSAFAQGYGRTGCPRLRYAAPSARSRDGTRPLTIKIIYAAKIQIQIHKTEIIFENQRTSPRIRPTILIRRKNSIGCTGGITQPWAIENPAGICESTVQKILKIKFSKKFKN
jgi:hypothetical protein